MSLYSWGANSYGQLGLDHKIDKLQPCKVKGLDGVPEYITGGGGHTLVIIDGLLFSCGSNYKGQLGIGHREDKPTLQPVSSLKHVKVRKVASGWDFTLALTEEGNVYSWGSNAFGQLGHTDVALEEQPRLLNLENRRFRDIACGLRHSLFLTANGNVFCCGAGRKGQLGYTSVDKPPSKVHKPVAVAIPNECGKVISVTAGAYHSTALTDKGGLLVWGDNKHGQCCIDPAANPVVMKPLGVSQEMCGNKSVSRVLSGWTHLLAKSVDGTLFSWGRNDYGQLGRPSSNDGATFDYLPKPVQIPQTSDFVCGSEHNIALLDSGAVVSWGWNEHGMCASGNEENVLTPKPIASLSQHKTVMVGSGHGHSLAFVRGDYEDS